MLFKKKPKTYTTPPGSLLTPTPAANADCIAPQVVADFLSGYGIPCVCVNAVAAPQLVRYDIRVADIYHYNANKIKKAAAALAARYNTTASITDSTAGDFALQITRQQRAPLYLREVMYTNTFDNAPRTVCAAGVDEYNKAVVIDIATAPHILIAGTTGSGKSVLLNSMIVSALYKVTPVCAQFIMIDPKQVELTAYDGLPHLATPIIRDAASAVSALANICGIMDDRYRRLSAAGVKQLADAPGLFPRMYVVIDELADLMLTSKKKVEAYIVRIAQLGRAAGIHLIVATQRPTTNIVTGLIKANIPTKIALAVSTTTDSVTILNHGGAEKLTGRGDAIIKTPDSIHERRFQAAFTPEIDIIRTVNAWKNQ